MMIDDQLTARAAAKRVQKIQAYSHMKMGFRLYLVKIAKI